MMTLNVYSDASMYAPTGLAGWAAICVKDNDIYRDSGTFLHGCVDKVAEFRAMLEGVRLGHHHGLMETCDELMLNSDSLTALSAFNMAFNSRVANDTVLTPFRHPNTLRTLFGGLLDQMASLLQPYPHLVVTVRHTRQADMAGSHYIRSCDKRSRTVMRAKREGRKPMPVNW